MSAVEIAVTAHAVGEAAKQMPDEVRRALVYIPEPGADHGVLVVPAEHEAAVRAEIAALDAPE